MRILLTLLAGILLSLVIGCGKTEDTSATTGTTGSSPSSSNSLEGTWKLEPSDPGVSGGVTFTADTFSMEFKEGERSETISGKYTVSGKTLTLTPEMEGGKPSSDKPETVTLADDMKSFEAPGLGKMVKQ